MHHINIRELDSMTDDEFYDFVQNGRGVVLDVSPEERAEMVAVHEAWTPTLNEDTRDEIDWSTATRSGWDLYAELRMNGVDFERVDALVPTA
ncbi:hypothetical protein G6L37_04780 [Agrobacterium rubi]|nr:hypothetical protein [Agrobacterium rubi]NTF24669.1 hypothetical protein [Agrobacterium rubi]